MNAKNTNRKSNKVYIVTFIVAVFFALALGFGINFALLGTYDSSMSDNIYISEIGVSVTHNIDFDDVILPSQTYSGENYALSVTNSGTSGAIYLKITYTSAHSQYVTPVLSDASKWAVGGANNNVYYYLGTLDKDASVSFLNGFLTTAFGTEISGQSYTATFKVDAIQAQHNAVQNDTNWTTNAPAQFKTLIGL